jgi:hypothetical protein
VTVVVQGPDYYGSPLHSHSFVHGKANPVLNYAMKIYGGADVEIHIFFATALAYHRSSLSVSFSLPSSSFQIYILLPWFGASKPDLSWLTIINLEVGLWLTSSIVVG